MIVTVDNFRTVIDQLLVQKTLSFDTETTGLFPHHGDRAFSIAISSEDSDYYFNWNQYPELDPKYLLKTPHIEGLKALFFDPSKHWFMHNAKFDLSMARMWQWEFGGDVWCTQAQARVENNELQKNEFSLAALGDKIGYAKDSTVEEYIKQHKLYGVDHKGEKKKRYDLVPFDIMSVYAMQDTRVTFALGQHQTASITVQNAKTPQNLPKLSDVALNEMDLTKALFEMEWVGAQADLGYCTEATAHEKFRMDKAVKDFEDLTGEKFKKSPKLFQHLFKEEEHKWGKTKKGNASIDGKVLKTLDHPAAKAIVAYTEAKNNIDFYQGFLKNADPQGAIHTSFNPDGARTGRLSSNKPNLQNMKKPDEDDLKQAEYVVRRAIVPREGYFFAMLDYDQIEYRMMLDIAKANGLIDKVLGGLDVHAATAENAHVTRDQAKTVNFLTLYGGGIAKLAIALNVSEDEARRIQHTIFQSAPEVKRYMNDVKFVAKKRKWIFNWLGRLYRFDDPNFSYKAPNTHIQGGAADVLKVAMVKVDAFLKDFKSRMVLNIHDELVFEIAFGEEHILPEIKTIMESVFPFKRLPLTVGIDYSLTSLADKKPFSLIDFQHGKETRDDIQTADIPEASGPTEFVG